MSDKKQISIFFKSGEEYKAVAQSKNINVGDHTVRIVLDGPERTKVLVMTEAVTHVIVKDVLDEGGQ